MMQGNTYLCLCQLVDGGGISLIIRELALLCDSLIRNNIIRCSLHS